MKLLRTRCPFATAAIAELSLLLWRSCKHSSRRIAAEHGLALCCAGTHILSQLCPQFLEILILNLPGVLWRLSFGPQPKEEPGSP